MADKEPLKIVFAPGAFDGFEGNQEELDNFIAEITQMANDGTLLDNSTPVSLPFDMDAEMLTGDMLSDLSLEDLQSLLDFIDSFDEDDENSPTGLTAEQQRLKKMN